MDLPPLNDRLISIKPRELSGGRAGNRYSFQQSWALTRLLHLHRLGKDYVLVLEYHDDVLVLNCSQNPTEIHFYQIKSEGRGWTINRLVTREEGDSGPLNSPLGKLVLNKLNFPDETRSLNFIAAQAFSVTLKGGKSKATVEKVSVNELCDEDKQKIVTALLAEHEIATLPECLDCINLETTGLSVKGHGAHALGELTAYLTSIFPNEKLDVATIYRALADEIKRKSNVETMPEDFAELCQDRSISRASFDGMLNDIRPDGRFRQFLSVVDNELSRVDLGFDDSLQIRAACETHEVDRMNAADAVVQTARKAIAAAVQKYRSEGPLPTRLYAAAVAVENRIDAKTRNLVRAKSREYRLAMIMMALYGI